MAMHKVSKTFNSATELLRILRSEKIIKSTIKIFNDRIRMIHMTGK